MACMTLADFAASLSCSILPRAEGMICQDKPYLSWSQPHLLGFPPSQSFSHSSSTSAWVSPFNAMNSCPASEKVADITDPLGPGPASPQRLTLPISAFLKTEA